ncbi:hypothetical protein [Sediminicoccus sp. KRV36]|uniref:hypothetical protein n=1 Tax=Sediminicoccus sp. KRV36 TaxID=3133721 RepID=UPI00200CA685|nr:hypothetical protein [Sediminicoccus rosea]UPY36910.1 hypothetical protein LHU95_22265 [Sediminicoccus rosea]
MAQILIILQGLLYSALVVTLLSNRLSRGRNGAMPVLAATAALILLHGVLSFLVPPEWLVTWLVFWLPGHILTAIVLLWMRRPKE